jgi:NAD(P)-dependent dehydrogenase (short-subunit alcohol dehydrogenase family)
MSRIALVTGAASGIGRACAEKLAQDGFTVVSLDRDPISDPPGPAVEYDLADVGGLGALLERIAKETGPVDVLVNNAAFFASTPVDTLTLDEVQRVLDVNLLAGVMLSVLTGREMRARGWGRIISVTSIKDAFGEVNSLAYDVAKGGLAQATRTLAVELGRDGVLVNAVAPGYVSTAMSVIDGENELESDWFRANFVESGRLPLGRAAEPSEIAACVAWLASEASSYVNGATFRLDGGLSVAL